MKRVQQLYVERFDRRDWDGVRELVSAAARLNVAERFAGKFSEAPHFVWSDFLARGFGLEDLANSGVLILCRIPGIHLFGRGGRLSDFPGRIGILVFEGLRKGRKRGDIGTFVDRLAVKTPKPCCLGASGYLEPDRHRDKPEVKMPTPNGRWPGHTSS